MTDELFPAEPATKPKRPRARVMSPEEVVQTAPAQAAEPTPEPTAELGGALVTMAVANALQTFTNPENFSNLTAKMREELARETFDPTTAKGRKYIAKRAMDVRRAKARLDDARNELLNGARATIKSVNASWSGMEEELNALAVEVRRPADEWEAKEAERVGNCSRIIGMIKAAAVITDDDTSETVRQRGEATYDMAFDADMFGDMLIHAQDAKDAAVDALGKAYNRLKAAEDAAARLAQLEAAEAERQRVEAERLAAEAEAQRLRDEAAEKAERVMREAEEQRLAEIAAQEAEVERLRMAADQAAERERERLNAEREQERQAERDASAERERAHEAELAEAREEAARAKRLQEAEAARIAEVERKREAAEKVERDRVAAEQAAQKVKDEDLAHKKKVLGLIKAALIEHGEIDEKQARAIALALANRMIPQTTVVW